MAWADTCSSEEQVSGGAAAPSPREKHQAYLSQDPQSFTSGSLQQNQKVLQDPHK